MKGVVIYKSKYGTTHQYAKWVGGDLNLPVFEIGELNAAKLNNYDFIIAGSSVYMGKMLIKKWLKDNLDAVWHKKVFLFVVSGTPLNKKDKLDSYVSASVPEEVRNRIDIYFVPGKLIVKELSLFDRLIITAAARLGEKKGTKKQVLDYDNVNRNSLGDLINAVRIFSNEKNSFKQLSRTHFDFQKK